MPIYLYACEDCSEEWKESHGMSEEIEECGTCQSKNIYRKPSLFANLSKRVDDKKQKVGSHVKEFIKNSEEQLKQQKKELRGKR
jgi:putative FmdB family regulatory protein